MWLDSQVRYVCSTQRGQQASSPKEAVVHDSETLQQLLPVNQVRHYASCVLSLLVMEDCEHLCVVSVPDYV